MKVLLVNGGPHQHGCVYTALEEVAKELNKEDIETEIIWLGLKPIAGCIACKKCAETGKCVFDDIVNEFVEKAKDTDGFIFGSPVHYAGATGAITSFMDRAFYSASMVERQIDFYLSLQQQLFRQGEQEQQQHMTN